MTKYQRWEAQHTFRWHVASMANHRADAARRGLPPVRAHLQLLTRRALEVAGIWR